MPTAATTTAPRLDYLEFQKIAPEFLTGMAAIKHALKKSNIGPELCELIKVRASQLNGCAFCIQFHLNEARKLGVPGEKLDLVAAWREAGVFSPREIVALEWTEQVTLLAQNHISDEVYAQAEAQFPQPDLTLLTVAIGHINAWNRIAAPFQFTPPIPGVV